MSKKIAQTISVLFHPLLMPTYSLLLLFQLNTYLSYTLPKAFQSLLIVLIFMNTAIFPLVVILFLARKKIVGSIYLETKTERVFPFLMALLFYGFTYYLLKQINLPQPLFSIFFGAFIALLLSTLLNFWKKISIHLVGVSGLFGGFYALSLMLGLEILPILIIMIFIMGFVASARLKLQSHLVSEIVLGFFVGFTTEYISVVMRLG